MLVLWSGCTPLFWIFFAKSETGWCSIKLWNLTGYTVSLDELLET
jgi:hypothetical protein